MSFASCKAWFRVDAGSSTRCRVPFEISNHGKKGKSWPKYDRGIGKRSSQMILKKTGVFLPAGSGKISFCLILRLHLKCLFFT